MTKLWRNYVYNPIDWEGRKVTLGSVVWTQACIFFFSFFFFLFLLLPFNLSVSCYFPLARSSPELWSLESANRMRMCQRAGTRSRFVVLLDATRGVTILECRQAAGSQWCQAQGTMIQRIHAVRILAMQVESWADGLVAVGTQTLLLLVAPLQDVVRASTSFTKKRGQEQKHHSEEIDPERSEYLIDYCFSDSLISRYLRHLRKQHRASKKYANALTFWLSYRACNIWEQGNASKESASRPKGSLQLPHRNSRSSSIAVANLSWCPFCSSSPKDP